MLNYRNTLSLIGITKGLEQCYDSNKQLLSNFLTRLFMKTLLVLLALFISVAEAETYRCKNNGKTSFQDTPSETEGDKFDYGTDISIEKEKEVQEGAINTYYDNARGNKESLYQKAQAALANLNINKKKSDCERKYENAWARCNAKYKGQCTYLGNEYKPSCKL